MSRRKFLGKLAATGIGGAAAITNLQNSDTVTLGRAKPVSIEVLETPLSDEARTLLQVAWSSPDPLGINGSAAIKEVLSNPSYFPSELQKLAADIGKLMPASGVQLDFKEGNWNVAGTVSVSIPATLTLYGERGLDTGTFLHEALHANVVSRWRSLSLMAGKQGERGQRQRDRLGITPAESEAYLQFENIWEEFKDASNKDFTGMDKSNSNYISLDQSRSSIDEFFVRALTDANFQKYLSTKRYEGKTLLERFKNWVAETIFGSRSGEEASWLDAALTASGDLSATLSTRTPDFAVVERVNEINNGPLASAPEQEISYSRRELGYYGTIHCGPKGTPDSPRSPN